MEIDKKVLSLWKKKSKRLERFKLCPFCSDSGCDNPDYHEKQLMQLAFELGKKEKK